MNLRTLDIQDLGKVLSMDRDTSLFDPTTMLQSSEEELTKCLLSGMSVGMESRGELLSIVLIYGDDYGFCSYVEKCITLPEHRGLGFQKRLIKRGMAAGSRRDYRVCAALCDPRNSISRRNFNKLGFKESGVKEDLFEKGTKRILFLCSLI